MSGQGKEKEHIVFRASRRKESENGYSGKVVRSSPNIALDRGNQGMQLGNWESSRGILRGGEGPPHGVKPATRRRRERHA